MKLRSVLLSLGLAGLVTAAMAADNNAFTLVSSGGKTVGKASYTIDKTKTGYKVRSRFEYRVAAQGLTAGNDVTRPGGGAGAPTDAQYSFEYSTDASGNFLSGFTQNYATQTLTSFTPSKARDTLTIGGTQAAIQTGSRTLQLPKPDFLLAPDYDPSAIQVLLTSFMAQPHADSTYLLIVPPPAQSPAAGTTAQYVTLQATGDAEGTLDGKPVALKHYRMNYHVGSADLYADASGTLMQATLGPLNASYIRAKFVLAAQP